MKLSAFISQHHDEIVGRWSQKVVTRLRIDLDRGPQLINDMPELLHDLVEALNKTPDNWASTSARGHARQRIALGVDIGGLSEEIGTVGEAIIELAGEHGCKLEASEVAALLRMLARGTAESVTEYARLRDGQLARESARHFSFIAHELRTPLQSARLAVATLPTSLGRVVERLERAHQQLVDLVDNSLVDARLTSEPVVQKETTSSEELVQAALANATDLAEQRSVAVSGKAEEFEIDVDRKLLVSALTNLVINGVKFSKEGGHVVVRATAQEDRVHFEVEDSCGGLPDAALPTLFQPFTQLGSDRTGFGLGLMIVKQAVEAHGGSVRVTNHPGTGCCFVVELPRNRSRMSRADLK